MRTNIEFAVMDLRRTLTNARAYEEIWWLLDGRHPERETITKASWRYSAFFQILPRGMFEAFITSLSSVFDGSSDCISIRSVPEIVADSAFATLWDRGRRLYKFRSKVIAHRNAKIDSVDFARDTDFTYDEIRRILRETCDLYDRYALARNLEPIPSSHPSSGDDLLCLIRKVTE